MHRTFRAALRNSPQPQQRLKSVGFCTPTRVARRFRPQASPFAARRRYQLLMTVVTDEMTATCPSCRGRLGLSMLSRATA